MSDKVKLRVDFSDITNSHIAYGQVNNTSTSTVFTATVPNVNSLVDGTAVMLRNGIVTSASGFTLNVNGLGAKPVYNNMADATQDTTIFNINYTMLFVYDSTRVSNGCWICYRGYNSDTNTIGYQIRSNSSVFTASDKGYRYRLWLQCPDGKLMPVNTSTSTNATANRSSYMNTRKFVLGGKIVYNSTKADYSADAALPANTLWQQYNFTFGYSFNNMGSALTLTPNAPIYMVCTDEGDGLGKLASPYYTQTLPNSVDNKLYVYLGMVTAATTVELGLEHPIFEYRNGAIGLWSNNGHSHTTSQITDFPSTMTPSSHAHGNLQNDGSVGTSNNASKNVVTDSNGKITTEAKPTIPSNTSELTNDSGFLTSHQDISGKLDKAQTSYKGKNVVVDSTSGNITFEDKNNHTHSQYLTSHQSLANYVTTDDSRLSDSRTPTSHTHGNLQNNGQVGSTAQANKNVVTNSSGLITTEDKPTIPSASSTTPSADTTNGSVGNGTTWARSNHTHPKSSLYAEASHTHTKSEVTDFPTLHTVATSGSYNDLSDKPNIPESSTVDTTLSGTSNNAIANSTVKNALDNKLDKTHTSYKGKNVVTNGSTGAIEFEEKNNHTHSQYLTEHQSLTNYVQKNNTNGLLKNDGTVDTTSYSTFNGNYNNLTNKPTIPTKTSDLTNDSGFLTSHQNIKTVNGDSLIGTGNVTIDYNDLDNKPTIPSDVSDLTDTQNTQFTPKSHTHTVSNITNFPSIPSKTSDLQNDGDGTNAFLTQHQSLTNYIQKSSTTGLLQNDGTVNTTLIQNVNDIGQTLSGLSDVASSGDYDDLANKPSYTPTITSTTTGAYKIGSIDISGSSVDIYGKDTDTHQTLKTINNESLIGIGNITIENEEIEYLNGNFSDSSSFFIIASSTKTSIDNGDRFYIHILNTSTSPSNTRLTISYGSGSYYASGEIYDKSYNRIPSNQININTILLVECVADNGYSWNIIEAFNGDVNNSHTHSQYLTSSDITGKEDKTNKISSISSLSTDSEYPTAKAVYDATKNNINKKYDYTEDIPYSLDDDYTFTLSNGVAGGSHQLGYLSKGFSNKGDWEISLKLKTSYWDGGFTLLLNPYKSEDFPDCNQIWDCIYNYGYMDCLQWVDGNIKINIEGLVSTGISYTRNSVLDVKLVKEGQTFKYYESGTLKGSYNLPKLETAPTVHLGVMTWGGSGSVSTFEDVVVTYSNPPKLSDINVNFLDTIYPIGSIYMSVNNTNPSSLFGGTWVQLKDTFLLACGDTYSSDGNNVTTAQHGEATHTLTTDEMPSHTHTQNSHNHRQGNSTVVYNASGTQRLYGSGSSTVVSLNTNVGINTNSETATNQNTGGGLEHNNMPPYMSVYMWKRTE